MTRLGWLFVVWLGFLVAVNFWVGGALAAVVAYVAFLTAFALGRAFPWGRRG